MKFFQVFTRSTGQASVHIAALFSIIKNNNHQLANSTVNEQSINQNTFIQHGNSEDQSVCQLSNAWRLAAAPFGVAQLATAELNVYHLYLISVTTRVTPGRPTLGAVASHQCRKIRTGDGPSQAGALPSV